MATLSRLSLSSLAALLVAAPTLSVPLQAELPQQRPDFARFAATQEQRTIPETINDQDRVTLRGNVHAALRDAQEIGLTDPSTPMDKMILTLRMAPDAQYRMDQLLAAQQDPKSPYYHQWLKPEQFGQMFGPSQADLNAVTSWLLSKGFRVDEIAAGRLTLTFSGNVAQVQNAFRTSIRDYKVDGVDRQANAEDPSIPAALSNVVAGIVSLHNIPRRNYNTGIHNLSPQDAAAVSAKSRGIIADWKGTANGVSGTYLSPKDWATIYDANASYTANGTGTGVVIGIVGRTNPGTANWATFRSTLGLPANTPTIIVNGTNPGDLGAGEDGEADLDAEWSGGVAPGATVKFVASKSTHTTDGVDLSAQYIVNNNLADVMSTSFGQCESSMGSTENTFYNNLWSQAATQGITSCISTGDSGPAGCNGGNDASGTGGYGVNGLASTPYNIAVGATQLSTSSSYWDASGNATSYNPETPWNESGTVSGGSGLWSTSSGASSTYTKPSWQIAPGVPATSHRYLPDISLDGSDMFFGNYGMLVYSQGAMATTGGTSAASPSFAGVMALVVQKYGRQGNANTKLYTLGQAQLSGAGTAQMFHDITSGNNNVPGLTGFTAAAGWDEATGLGTPDVTTMINNWVDITPPAAVTASESGTSGTITLSGSATDNIGVNHIDFLVDGTVKATASASPYNATLDSTTLTNASHALVAKAYDAAGNNASSTSVPFTISNLDTTAPTATASESGSSGTITLSATAADNVGVLKVWFYVDGAWVGTDPSAPYSLNIDSTTLSNGSHTLVTKGVDSAGNVGASTPVTFTVNNIPGPTTTASESGTAGSITLNANAIATNAPVLKVWFYIDGAWVATDTAAPYSVAFNSTALTDGSHTLVAKGVDVNGVVGASAPVTFTINNAGADTQAPVTTASESGTAGTITLSATATDNVGVLKVWFYIDGTWVGTDTAAPYSLQIDSTTLTNGSHTLVAKGVDATGNVGASSPVTFTVSN